jgi:PTH1 family peptidyl-tRNA hydrolase
LLQNSPSKLLIVGLGNPGERYAATRHNVGYRVLLHWAAQEKMAFKMDKRFFGLVARKKIGECEAHLLLPTTYMNESGRAARRYMDYLKISCEELLVVSDDVDLPFGKLRLRLFGSPGSHNGLKSIQQHAGGGGYSRLRIGIGRNPGDKSLADYVLENFSAEESQRLPGIVEEAVRALELVVHISAEKAMQFINTTI